MPDHPFLGIALDGRLAWRFLGRNRASTLLCVIVLALGISTLTTVFSFVYAILFRLPPYPEARSLVAVTEEVSGQVGSFSSVSLETVEAIREGVGAFDGVAAFREHALVLPGFVRSIGVTEVDSAVFHVLGASLFRGRFFTADEIQQAAPVLLISYSIWQSHFGADPEVLGSTIQIDQTTYHIIGILEAGFRFSTRSDAWLPLARQRPGSDADEVSLIGRIRRNASREDVDRELLLVSRRLMLSNPSYYRNRALVRRDGMVDRGPTGPASFIGAVFLGASLCVLLVACVNVANILIARGAGRRRSLAICATLGATQARLIRQGLLESLLLGAAACTLGLLLSVVLTRLALAYLPFSDLPAWIRVDVDGRVFAFCCLVSLIAVASFGIRVATENAKFDLTQALKIGGEAGATSRMNSKLARRGVIVQFAASVLLLGAAALLLETIRRVSEIGPGYDRSRLLRVFVSGKNRDSVYSRLADRLAPISDVNITATSGFLSPGQFTPKAAVISESERFDDGVYLGEGTQSLSRGRWPRFRRLVVSDQYFRTVGVPVMSGKGFEPTASPKTELVVVVSAEVARIAWGTQAAIGRKLRIGKTGPLFTVVGVVGDTRSPRAGPAGFTYEPTPDLYFDRKQVQANSTELLLRTSGNSAVIQAAVQARMDGLVDGRQVFSIDRVEDLDTVDLKAVVAIGIFMATFAAAALVLALVGVYGVMSEGIFRRTREFGIRMALGASPAGVQAMALREALVTSWIGLGIGIGMSLLAAPVLRFFVWGISPFNAWVYVVICAVLSVASFGTCYGPTRAITAMNPSDALRLE